MSWLQPDVDFKQEMSNILSILSNLIFRHTDLIVMLRFICFWLLMMALIGQCLAYQRQRNLAANIQYKQSDHYAAIKKCAAIAQRL